MTEDNKSDAPAGGRKLAEDAMQEGFRRLTESGVENPRLDAGLMLARAMGTDRLGYFRDPRRILTESEVEAFEAMLRRREAREPLAYIFGVREFFGLDFIVTRDVLIPRPETELLVGLALTWIDSNAPGVPAPLLGDVGTGSGAVSIAAAVARPASRWIASDISPKALTVAEENARRHGVEGRVSFRQGSLMEPLPEIFDVLCSNPPYVAATEAGTLAPELRDWEPHCALFGGGDGLDVLRALIAAVPPRLKPGGMLALEIGFDQAEAAASLIAATGAFGKAEIVHDLAGHPRCIAALRR